MTGGKAKALLTAIAVAVLLACSRASVGESWVVPPFARNCLPTLHSCINGPDVIEADRCLQRYDLDCDGDCDLADFAIVQRLAVMRIPPHWWYKSQFVGSEGAFRDDKRRKFHDWPVLMRGPRLCVPCKARLYYDGDLDGDIDLQDFVDLQQTWFCCDNLGE